MMLYSETFGKRKNYAVTFIDKYKCARMIANIYFSNYLPKLKITQNSH